MRTWRWPLINHASVTIELNASVAHTLLKIGRKTAIITNYLVIPASSISVIVNVLWIESPLHGCKALIRL